MARTSYAIALGSNRRSRYGSPAATVRAAIAALKAIERAFGRRNGRRWGPRGLDLDIILWAGGAWGGPGPIIPHPEFRTRAFVLEPLAEIAPALRDPVTGKTIGALLAAL